MESVDFKNIAQGAQAIIFALGAILGAIWALLRFGITKEGDRANLEVERLKNEAYKLGGIAKSSTVRAFKQDNGHYLVQIDFVLENRGVHSERCYYREPPVVVSQITHADGDEVFTEVLRKKILVANHDPNSNATFNVSYVLRPHIPLTLSTSCELAEPGNYMFSLILEKDKPQAVLASDRDVEDSVDKEFESYREHPLFDESKMNFEAVSIHTYHYVGEETINSALPGNSNKQG